MVIEQVDESSEGFSRAIPLGGLIQEFDQLIINVSFTWVGLFQYAVVTPGRAALRNSAVLSQR